MNPNCSSENKRGKETHRIKGRSPFLDRFHSLSKCSLTLLGAVEVPTRFPQVSFLLHGEKWGTSM